MPAEDTWRPPTWWCPDTQYWHAADDQATEDEVTELVAAFVRALQPETAAETGTWAGSTTKAIGAALARNGHGHLWAVEINPGMAERARQACAGLPVTVITGDSMAWEPPPGIGFAWIDGAARRDLEAERILGRMLPGAVIGIHDTGPLHAPGRLDWLEAHPRLSSITLRTPRGVSFATVTA
jgi:predicted O-methyltransferase YrrM